MDELDSMSTVEFLVALERHFAIEIPDKDAETILTFRQLVDYLESRVVGEPRGCGQESGPLTRSGHS